MKFLYNFLLTAVSLFLSILAIFRKKIKVFVHGRKHVFKTLETAIHPADKIAWFHCASLGEFEQAVPVIEAFKKEYPDFKILISFFSPSGYENKKNTTLADIVVYLPLDTISNAKRFINISRPNIVFFVKYEFWPNYLKELKSKKIPTFLISGAFRKNQIFFKSYGVFMKNALKSFDYFFLQNQESLLLLESIGIKNAVVSGDTRFDRVQEQLQRDNFLEFAEEFKNERICIVAGSTWTEDHELLLDSINNLNENTCFIIAPHKIEKNTIDSLINRISKKVVLHSEIDIKTNLKDYQVLIIDCIGLLSRLYNYADLTYVGGAAGKTGLHNILEPATFGVPIVIGKNYSEFPEAAKLRQRKALYSVSNDKQCSEILSELIKNDLRRESAGQISKNFIFENTGATEKIMNFLKTNKVFLKN